MLGKYLCTHYANVWGDDIGGSRALNIKLSIIYYFFQINSVDNKNLDASLIIIIKSETCFFNSLYRLVFSSLAKSSISCNKSVIPGKAAPPYALNLLGANMAFLVSGRPTPKKNRLVEHYFEYSRSFQLEKRR